MAREQRTRLLAHAPLERCTPGTITDLDKLERELKRVQRDGYAMDNEEFLPGLLCLAVLVPGAGGTRSNLCIAVQAPIMRISPAKGKLLLPALRRAAQALGGIDADVAASREPAAKARA